ncbi:MAG TPA: PIN domain-containing protein [Candidatus Limnocylindria bacterium]|nr:PIN domain-containing protein [Candidatus Limnocylindria bacterium]
MSYVLDSTVIIDYVIGYGPGEAIVDRLFAQVEELYVCDVVTCESLSKGSPDDLAVAQSLLDALEYVALSPAGARWAGERRREQIESGRRKPSTADALIAALANSLGATVVTRNPKDFASFDVPVMGYGQPPS